MNLITRTTSIDTPQSEGSAKTGPATWLLIMFNCTLHVIQADFIAHQITNEVNNAYHYAKEKQTAKIWNGSTIYLTHKNNELLLFFKQKKIVTRGKDLPLYVDVYLNPQQSVTCHDRMIKVWYTPNISSFYIYILVKTWSGWISDDLAIIKADFTVFN